MLLFLILSMSLAKKSVFNRNAYIAASIVKTLGAKEGFKSLMFKFTHLCRRLSVVSVIKNSIKKINFLTSKEPLKTGIRFAKTALRSVFGRTR